MTARPPQGFGALAGMSLATLAILIAVAVVATPIISLEACCQRPAFLAAGRKAGDRTPV